MKSHKLKSTVLKILDALPSKIGYFMYHQLQKRSFKNIDDKILANENSYSTIQNILRINKISLENKNILEIGSGWLPLMPYLFKIHGNVNTVYTYDINKHYNNANILKVHFHFNVKNIELAERRKLKLPEFIKYYPNKNLISSDLPNNINLYFSRFVLEHVSPEDIFKMHKKLFNEMNGDDAILHLISPSDHRAYSDSSISYYDFLKYSEKEWNKIQTKFDYHNRLRLPQYLKIFKNTGFEIAYLDFDSAPKNSDKYKKFKELTLHSDYAKYTEEEILAGSINVLLKKPIQA